MAPRNHPSGVACSVDTSAPNVWGARGCTAIHQDPQRSRWRVVSCGSSLSILRTPSTLSGSSLSDSPCRIKPTSRERLLACSRQSDVTCSKFHACVSRLSIDRANRPADPTEIPQAHVRQSTCTCSPSPGAPLAVCVYTVFHSMNRAEGLTNDNTSVCKCKRQGK